MARSDASCDVSASVQTCAAEAAELLVRRGPCGGMKSGTAFDKLVQEMGLGEGAAAALRNYVDCLVVEKVDEMWSKGKHRLTQLQKGLAVCRAENEELRALLTGSSCPLQSAGVNVVSGVSHTGSSTASGTTSPPALEESETGSPELERPPFGELHGGLAACHVSAMPEMPAFLQPGAMPFALSAVLPPAFSPAPAPQSAKPPLQQEHRLLSLAEALADSLPAGPPTAPAGPPGIDDLPETFTLTLQKFGTELGLRVSHSEHSEEDPALTVHGIEEGCAAEAWNHVRRASGQPAVEPGDRIVAINGLEGCPEAMLEECKKKDTLTLTIVRPTALTLPGGGAGGAGCGSLMRADALVFVPWNEALMTGLGAVADDAKAGR